MNPALPSRRVLMAMGGLVLARPALALPPAIRLIVGAARGTSVDRWARGFAPFLERHLARSSVTVLNTPGEGGLVAARMIAAAAPEARDIGLVTTPALAARAIERGAANLLDTLTFVGAVTEEQVVLVAPPGTRLSDLRAGGPGRAIGCPPSGSAGHLLAIDLATSLPLTPLAFPNAASARQAVLAGNLAAAALLLPQVLPALREDRLVALAIGGTARSPVLPDVPLFSEKGMPSPLQATRGCILGRGARPAFVARLQTCLQAAVADPEFHEQAASGGFEPRAIPGAIWTEQIQRLSRQLAHRWERLPWIVQSDQSE